MGKIIVIEGTDCSGKETQQKLIIKRLQEEKYQIGSFSFPNYESPTGVIIGAAYLGKEYLTKQYLSDQYVSGLFSEDASTIDPYVASLYFSADRRLALPTLNKLINENELIFLDRYVSSNMAHQAGRLDTKEARTKMVDELEMLEYDILKLPKPDYTILLHLPYDYAKQLRIERDEKLDVVEQNKQYLIRAEQAYLELAKRYNYHVINCVKDNKIKTIQEINDEIYNYIKEML